jgi:hypothetical protein
MNVKEAVKLAKIQVLDLFAGEQAENVGLEEVEYDDTTNVWHITIGFSRPWERQLVALGPKRSYKVVNIAENGTILSVKNYQTANA